MAAKKDHTPTMDSTLDIGSLFEQELQARNEDLRRQAAQTMFYKLHPSNNISVEQFITDVKQHRDVWAIVSTMGIVDFADAIAGGRTGGAVPPSDQPSRRTRLNETQKNAIKAAIRKLLDDSKDGLSRSEIAQCIPGDRLSTIGVSVDELANKLRQPLGELVSEGLIHTVGEKRLMKYWAGSGPRNKP